MKIGIDAHSVGRRATGNETYVANLVRALARVDRGDNEYTLYMDEQAAQVSPLVDDPRFSQRRVGPRSSLIRIPISLPIELWLRPVDVLHVQYNLPPLLRRCARVVTVHDISYEHCPEWFTRREWLRNRLSIRASARRSDVVIAVSEYTKQDVVKRYGIDPDRVVVTPEAADAAFRPPEDSGESERIIRIYGIDGPYFLYVGNIQPRKNLPRLIQAYSRLIATGDVPHRLVIAGKRAWLYAAVFEAAAQAGLKKQVIFTDYVPQEHLRHLYAKSVAFVYPSLFEGFGLPLLEAMASGTAVITSYTSSLPEVAGDAALYVNPYNTDDIEKALRRIACDSHLRDRLCAAGRKQAARFSWDETARRTLQAYEKGLQAAGRLKGTARPHPEDGIRTEKGNRYARCNDG